MTKMKYNVIYDKTPIILAIDESIKLSRTTIEPIHLKPNAPSRTMLSDSLDRLVEDGIVGERRLETLLATKTKSLKPSRDPRLKLAKEDT